MDDAEALRDAAPGDLARWLVQATPDGLWVLDAQGRTVFANDRMAQLLGRTAAQMAGLDAYSALDESGQGQLRQHLAELESVAKSGDNLECSLLREDGQRFTALISHTPILDDRGRRRGWLHRVTEYTERQRLLETLQRREQQLAEAQAIAKIGSWEWDVVGDVVTWSDELFRIYGVSPGDLEPTYEGFIEGLHPDDRQTVHETVSGVLAGGESFEFDARIRRVQGAVGWIRGRGIVVRDERGAPVRMSGTAQDITDAKDAEHALALLRAVATAANDADTLAEAVPVAAAEVSRYTAWQPLGAYLVTGEEGLLELSLGAQPPTAADGLAEAVQAMASRAALEGGLVTQPSDDTLLLAAPLVVEEDVVGVVVLRREGTVEPEEWETATIAQAMAVFARVAEREEASASLAAARDEAMSASRAKSDFLATMSHEIRTPLNGVIGLSELLSRTELTERQRRLTEGIEEAGKALLGLVNDILDLSKIEAGRLELEEVDFDPRAVIEHSTSLLSQSAQAKSLELVIACHPDLPELVRGDPVRLGQVVTNLASNAVKFTTRGEVVVRATVDGTGDGAGGGQPHGSVRLRVEVSDTGVGIAEAEQGRLFEAFSQGDSSTTREFGGTGLGLAISSQIVNAMGGQIGLESRPGSGSTFWFTAAFAHPTQEPPPNVLAPSLVRGARVLVVDDNETNRVILLDQLEAWGAHGRAAASAVQGLILLEEAQAGGAPFEVVLLDYLMPGVDGLQFARRVRKEGRHDATRLLLLTSAGDLDTAGLADAGVDRALAKPVLAHRLLDAVAALRSGTVRGSSSGPGPGREASATARADTHGPQAPTKGRVLLVEDNPMNQMVAEGILAALGYDVVLAMDGREAVSRFADDPYAVDAVLMDCQMPVMDGYEATRTIRALEGSGRRVPIIALTAAAVAGERERCLSAGMDDFLTKPVDVTQLQESLERWLAASEGGEGAAPDPWATPSQSPAVELSALAEDSAGPSAEPVDPDILDRSRLDELLDLDPGDPTMLLRFIGRFGGNARRTATEMRRAREEGTAYELGRLAHALKGSAANLGAHRLAALCEQIEHLAEDDVVVDGKALDRVADEVEAAAGALEELASALQDAADR
ncbi:response regulator [Pedococcus sp. 5OH_020]|uniref:response regulator n=1 Tax=Pedococcus sp. 5OH_020 TaxID=2989814 RepID=UPI0022E9D20F|nr:response regulator [Pedococcus sp. 5OH_020]